MEIFDVIADYPSVDSNRFYLDIFRKQEFHSLRDAPDDSNFYRAHQQIIARFISHWTLYNGLLLIHDTGTGKSGSAVAVYEGLQRHTPVHVLYLCSNDSLIDNFKNELIKLSPSLRSLVQAETTDDLDHDHMKRVRNRVLARANFEFFTYQTFVSNRLKAKYSLPGALFIFDEIHNLIVEGLEHPDSVYSRLLAWTHSIPHKRVLLMTATPMRNNLSEIAPIFNLILPQDAWFPNPKQFEDEYFDTLPTAASIPILDWKPGKAAEFENKIKGYVSVVRQRTSVKITYPGFVIHPMQHYRVYAHTMHEHQMKGYATAWKADRKNATSLTELASSFYSNSRQATLFVYPDFTYGMTGYAKYLHGKNRLTKAFFKEAGFRANDAEHNLKMLRKYSSTYASVIEHILYHPNEHIFVYCDKVNGSGILVCIALLTNLFGYTNFRGRDMDWKQKHQRRLIFLNNIQEDKVAEFQNVINIFNDPRNLYADHIHVVFGTDRTKEGISLKRIRQIHILTPDWNFGKMFQAMGRGIRYQSHADLDPSEQTVSIFFHCAMPRSQQDQAPPPAALPTQHQQQQQQQDDDDYDVVEDPGENTFTAAQVDASIDFYRYLRSEMRDRNIKKIEYSLLVSAFDCELNKPLNTRTGMEDDSADCYYRACAYVCKGFEYDPPYTIDFSSYDNYYISENIQRCTDAILHLFQQFPVWTFQQLQATLHPLFTSRELFEAVHMIVDTPIPIMYRGYQKMYIMKQHDRLFLIDDLTMTSSSVDHLELFTRYSTTPSFMSAVPMERLVFMRQRHSILRITKEILRFLIQPGDYYNHLVRLMKTIPDHYHEVLFLTFLAKNQLPPDHVLLPFLLTFYDKRVRQDGNVWTHYLFDRPRVFNPAKDAWEDTDATTMIVSAAVPPAVTDHDAPEFVKKYITDNVTGLYGFVAFNAKTLASSFKIRDLSIAKKDVKDKKHATIGRTCTSYTLDELLIFAYRLGLRFPTQPPANAEELAEYNSTALITNKTLSTLVKSKAGWKKITDRLPDAPESDLMRFYHYYRAKSKDQLCVMLRDMLQAKHLMVPAPAAKSLAKSA